MNRIEFLATTILGFFKPSVIENPQEQYMKRVNNTLIELLDSHTNEYVTFSKVTKFADGSDMENDKCDGVIYRKLGSEYFKRNFTGPVSVEWFGVSPSNSPDKNSLNFKNIPALISLSFSEGTYKFSEAISFNGNDFIGVSKETILKFENSDGIVIDRNFLDEFGSNNYLKYISKKEFKNLKIEASGHPFYFLKSAITFESLSYCSFENLHLKSNVSLFFSDIVPTNDNYFCYANSFKQIIAETQDAVFENCSLSIATSMDNIHDQSCTVIFKNCLLDVECTNFNFGFAYNIRHVIFNNLVESNYHRATFTGCNFEQLRSNPVVNLNVNAVFDIKFDNCFVHFGDENLGTQLEGQPVFVYDQDYTDIANCIIPKNYALSDDFFPIIGFNIYVFYKRCRLEVFDDVPNKNELMMSVQVNTLSAGKEVKSSEIIGYKYRYAYLSREVIGYLNPEIKVNLQKIGAENFTPFESIQKNVEGEMIMSKFFLAKELKIEEYTFGDKKNNGYIIFDLPAVTTMSKDDLNYGMKEFSILKNISNNKASIYFNDNYIVELIKNHLYLFNGETNTCVDITSLSYNKFGAFANKPTDVPPGFTYYCFDKSGPSIPGSPLGCLITKHSAGNWIDAFGATVS